VSPSVHHRQHDNFEDQIINDLLIGQNLHKKKHSELFTLETKQNVTLKSHGLEE
jgi:hypothetical protein